MTTASPARETGIYLAHALAPFAAHLQRGDVTDLYVNRPGELWLETLGGQIERHDLPGCDDRLLLRLAEQVAALTAQGINARHPILSAVLPDSARVQFIAPPATRGPVAMAIRKHQSAHLRLDDYAATGAFAMAGPAAAADALATALRGLKAKGDHVGLLRLAVRQRLNILVSGGTSTGKTTFLNALIHEIAPDERLILIEDTPELEMHHANAVGLVAARSPLGEADVAAEDLLNAALRMRPDRIILGELRGPEAFTFLRAVNTGHPGSMTTIHADSPARAIEQLALLVLQSGTSLDRDSIAHYVRSSIDLYVQLARQGGRRHISAIALRGEAAG
ncbi:MAG: P-type DNA transfer ATPase VirB11 [Sphingomonadales bacterium]|jgi:type IV secretion system protein VirB11